MELNIENQLIEQLEKLIDHQLELSREGKADSSDMEQITEQASTIAGQLAEMNVPERSEFRIKLQRINDKYKDLNLAIMSEQKQITNELIKTRTNKKAVKAYDENL